MNRRIKEASGRLLLIFKMFADDGATGTTGVASCTMAVSEGLPSPGVGDASIIVVVWLLQVKEVAAMDGRREGERRSRGTVVGREVRGFSRSSFVIVKL